MGYDDEAERSRNRRSRARQPVKRMGDREIEQRRYREPGHSQPGLNLITDTFREDGGRRQNYDRPGPEKESRRQKRGRKNRCIMACFYAPKESKNIPTASESGFFRKKSGFSGLRTMAFR